MRKQKEQPRPYIPDLSASLLAAALLVLDQFVEGAENPSLRILGLLSLLLAAIFMFTPFYFLKRYGRIKEGESVVYTNQLVDRGIYAIVRHPQYLGYSLLVLGFTLLSQYWATALLGLGAIAFFYLQAVQEEHFLRRQFDQVYDAYCQQVPRFNFILGILRLWSK